MKYKLEYCSNCKYSGYSFKRKTNMCKLLDKLTGSKTYCNYHQYKLLRRIFLKLFRKEG